MSSVSAFYDQMVPYILKELQLRSNEYPLWVIEEQQAIITPNIHNSTKRAIAKDGDNQRICERCSSNFDITSNTGSTCVHHPKRAWRKPGASMRRHLCCNAPFGSSGCVKLGYHVTHQFSAATLLEFVQAPAATADDERSKSVYALDAEFVFTARGAEIARLSVVDVDGAVKLDALIRPGHAILDCNTVYSGLTADKLDGAEYTLETDHLPRRAKRCFKFVNRETILIGHGLENDMKALRMVHTKIVDTSIAFPNRKPGMKFGLKELSSLYLRQNIQQGSQHCSAEDALACMKLMRQKVEPVSSAAARFSRLRVGN